METATELVGGDLFQHQTTDSIGRCPGKVVVSERVTGNSVVAFVAFGDESFFGVLDEEQVASPQPELPQIVG